MKLKLLRDTEINQEGTQNWGASSIRVLLKSGYQLYRKNRENGKKDSLSVSRKTQRIWKFYQITGNLVCLNCKFPDSKGKSCFNICLENFQFSFEA